MQWHDELLKADPVAQILVDAWQTIHDRVFQLAKDRGPFDEETDAWYAPNAAVGSAAFAAALVGCTLLKNGRLEESTSQGQWNLACEWSWYLIGHWPCMYYWPWGHTEISAAKITGGEK